MIHTENEEMTMGRAVQCPDCQRRSYLYPKAVGYQPYLWEINCTRCHRFDIGLNAYTPDHQFAVESLEQLRETCLNRADPQALHAQVGLLASKYDSVLATKKCECGGDLSIVAKPRCLFCDAVISDSFFHFVDEAPE